MNFFTYLFPSVNPLKISVKFHGTCPASGSSSCPANTGAAKAAAAADDDMEDMFGDDDEDEDDAEAAATKAREERMAKALKLKQESDAKKDIKKKEKPVERSLVVLDVKPWEADTDLEAVWKQIITKQQEGLTWGQAFKLEPVAYGIKKLVLTCSIVDSLVLLDDITEYIEEMEEFVQSVNIVSMNKIS